MATPESTNCARGFHLRCVNLYKTKTCQCDCHVQTPAVASLIDAACEATQHWTEDELEAAALADRRA